MKILNLALIFIALLSCATEKPDGKTEAEVLFKEANALIKDERYILATEKLNQLKNRFPYSFYATPAELLQADVLFYQESYVESAAAYLLFRDFHPKHARIPYVVYKIAESYYKQLPDTFDRDLDAAVEAIKYYSELLTKYSDSDLIKDAKKKIKKCRQMIRDKEQYVADFYYKTEVFKAARWRYTNILASFEDKDLRSHAMKRLVQTNYHLKEYNKCLEHASSFGKKVSKSDKVVVEKFQQYCTNKLK